MVVLVVSVAVVLMMVLLMLLMMWLLLVSHIVVDQIAAIVPGVQKIGAVWPLPGLRRSTNTNTAPPHGSRSWHHLWRLLEAAVVVVVCSCHSKLLLLLLHVLVVEHDLVVVVEVCLGHRVSELSVEVVVANRVMLRGLVRLWGVQKKVQLTFQLKFI